MLEFFVFRSFDKWFFFCLHINFSGREREVKFLGKFLMINIYLFVIHISYVVTITSQSLSSSVCPAMNRVSIICLMAALLPQNDNVRQLGYQRAYSFIQFCNVLFGTTTMWGPAKIKKLNVWTKKVELIIVEQSVVKDVKIYFIGLKKRLVWVVLE